MPFWKKNTNIKARQKKPAKAPHAIRTREIVYKKPHRPTAGYLLLSAIFSTLIFMFIYYGQIIALGRGWRPFGYTLLANFLAGILGSWIARAFVVNFEDMDFGPRALTQEFISAFIYSVFVYVGAFAWLLTRYIDINTMTLIEFIRYVFSKEILKLVAVMAAVKVFVYLLANYGSSKIFAA